MKNKPNQTQNKANSNPIYSTIFGANKSWKFALPQGSRFSHQNWWLGETAFEIIAGFGFFSATNYNHPVSKALIIILDEGQLIIDNYLFNADIEVLEMVVDCHTHLKSSDDGFSTSEHLETAQNVDVCIVLAGPDGESSEVNKSLSEYVSRHAEKVEGFAVINPAEDDINVKKLESIREKFGLKGFVLYCSRHGFHPTHSKAMRFYECVQELKMPVFFHNSSELTSDAVLEYTQPYLLDEVARQFGDLKIVIGSMGRPFIEQTLVMVDKHKNVYADLTIHTGCVWQTYNVVVAAYEYGVMDKLLFGSGFPHGNAQQCMETLLGFNKLLADTSLPNVPRGRIQNIIERDTLKLLGLKD